LQLQPAGVVGVGFQPNFAPPFYEPSQDVRHVDHVARVGTVLNRGVVMAYIVGWQFACFVDAVVDTRAPGVGITD
jgi:hypothetical protein